MTSKQIEAEIASLGDKERAVFSLGFFHIGRAGYPQTDKFYGTIVPEQRKIARKYYSLIDLKEVSKLLASKFHECRLTGLIILVYKFQRSKTKLERKQICDFYLQNLDAVNNWDLVDTSCYQILGSYLYNSDRSLLYSFADSGDIWKQRISIVSTMYFIKKDDLEDTFKLAEKLVYHSHDYIQKAVGWLIREAGKKDVNRLTKFLDKYAATMPRTALRYAIEKLDEKQRKHYLSLKQHKQNSRLDTTK